MSNELQSNQSADIRKAFERLQQALEMLGDRYRELRRERRRLLERIDELDREHSAAGVSVSAQLEAAVQDRRRLTELEERAFQAEKRQADLYHRIADLEEQISERDALIAEQEDSLNLMRAERDASRELAAGATEAIEQRDRDIAALRDELDGAVRRTETALERVAALESAGATSEAAAGERIARLTERVAEADASVRVLREDRSALEEKYLQTIAKLDASTRDAAMGRNRIAELERELAELESTLHEVKGRTEISDEERRELSRLRGLAGDRDEEMDVLRQDLATAVGRHAAVSHELKIAQTDLVRLREQLDAREREAQAARETLQRQKEEHDATIARLEDRYVDYDVELEIARKAMHELQTERDEARGTAESLLARLKSVEAVDEEETAARQGRIRELTHDLGEALDMAARYETDLIHARAEVERLQSRCSELSEEASRARSDYETLQERVAAGVEGGSGIGEEERQRLVDRIGRAIALIDRHIGD